VNNLNLKPAKFIAKLAAIIGLSGGSILTRKEFERLKELQAQVDRFTEQLAQFSDDRLKHDRRKAREQYDSNPTDQNLALLTELERQPQEALKSYRQMRSNINRAMKVHAEREVSPILLTILQRALGIAGEQAAAIEKQERVAAAAVGVPFEPSETLLAVQKRAERVQSDIERFDQGVHRQYARPDVALVLDAAGAAWLEARPKPRENFYGLEHRSPAQNGESTS
jgi:hypothetical protein